jgi:ABC-type uncharacterized transport system auxiliary subunit
MRNFFLAAILAVLTTGCSLFPNANKEPPRKFVLPILGNSSKYAPENVSPQSSFPRPYQIIIDLPSLYPPIDTARIALKPNEYLIDYYADVEWANRLNVLIQESLIYSLQNRSTFQGVSRPTEGIKGNYALKIEVRKFYINQHENLASSTAQVDYMVHLVKLPGRHVVASKSFSYTHAITGEKIDDLVNTLSRVHLQALEAVLLWIEYLLPPFGAEKQGL